MVQEGAKTCTVPSTLINSNGQGKCGHAPDVLTDPELLAVAVNQ